ncbi:MAG: hypothetical protein ISR58_12290 [Anaerolineales bacterium]|nr:hypothetical protein [Chloroflexota bacterium]MBL6981957.1 hypothetical protein [Anaerolineales bacterium]
MMSHFLDAIYDTSLPLLAALALSYLAYQVIHWTLGFLVQRGRSQALVDFTKRDDAVPEARLGTENYQIQSAFRALGIDARDREQRYLSLSYALVGILAMLPLLGLGLPLPLALLGGGLVGYLAMRGFIHSRWEKTRLAIEKDIPTLMRNLSGVLQTEHNVIRAIANANDALDPEKPLHGWIKYLLHEIHAYGFPAMDRLQNEANEISSSLGVVIFEIARMVQTGGEGYAQAFRMAADNLAQILDVRAEAAATASNAFSMARVIIAVAVVIFYILSSSPMGRSLLLGTQSMQLVMVAAVGWGVYGWIVIRDMVQEATQ